MGSSLLSYNEDDSLFGERLSGKLGRGLGDGGDFVVCRRGLFGLSDLLLLPGKALLVAGGEEGGEEVTVVGEGSGGVRRLKRAGDRLVMEERMSDFSLGFLLYCTFM